ncbi:MAG: T9SS type A sorting domain-containing protein [Ignavibacteriaceae bacterium]|nr:T9SS type A sorting domain-containing protein [Ignavibacteriaceae bacterium]
MKRLLPFFLVLFFASASFAQITVLDDFEAGAGHFNLQTNYSGSTVGVIGTIPTIDSTSGAYMGQKCLKIILMDDPAVPTNWAVRFLSGGGASGSNVDMGPNGWTGYWLKTDKAFLRTAPAIDAPSTAEIGDTMNVIGDGQWHVYQWNLGQDGQPMWHGWVTGNDTISDDPTPTYDAIWFFAPDGSDSTVLYLDYVAWNPSGYVPVELATFDAVVDGNNVDLRWATATETNNRGFEVERQFENGSFSKIAFVDGKGTTTDLNSYTYTDKVNQLGAYSYRLKQVDFDGTFEYSNIVQVNVNAIPGEYTLAQNYPNPFNPTTSLTYNIPENGNVSLSVFNLLGEKVAQLVNTMQTAGTHTVNFNASSLASGTYIYTLNVNGNNITKKMVLMK